MKTYYEAHITMLGDPAALKPLVEDVGWKFSCIDGDPVLGAGIKCYATTFFNTKRSVDEVVAQLAFTATILTNQGAKVTRRKVEHVIYDDRSTLVCEDDCAACSSD